MSVPTTVCRRPTRSTWNVPARHVGLFFVWTSGIHVGIVAADPALYRHFADGALVPGLAEAWRSTFMIHATTAGLVLAAGEGELGLLLLKSWPRRRMGWVGTIVFHLALMCFGWGFWVWSLPALTVLLRGARHDSRSQMAIGHHGQ
jgi:hypothetical protein